MVASVRHSTLRDLIALVIVAAACPIAVFGGTQLGCVGQSFESECAMRAGFFISPLLLVLAGFLAALVTRGWTGLLVVLVGTLTGMVAILALSFGVSRPVPLDWFSAVVATIWFVAPIMIGYGVGRLVHRRYVARMGRGTDSDGAGEDTGAGI